MLNRLAECGTVALQADRAAARRNAGLGLLRGSSRYVSGHVRAVAASVVAGAERATPFVRSGSRPNPPAACPRAALSSPIRRTNPRFWSVFLLRRRRTLRMDVQNRSPEFLEGGSSTTLWLAWKGRSRDPRKSNLELASDRQQDERGKGAFSETSDPGEAAVPSERARNWRRGRRRSRSGPRARCRTTQTSATVHRLEAQKQQRRGGTLLPDLEPPNLGESGSITARRLTDGRPSTSCLRRRSTPRADSQTPRSLLGDLAPTAAPIYRNQGQFAPGIGAVSQQPRRPHPPAAHEKRGGSRRPVGTAGRAGGRRPGGIRSGCPPRSGTRAAPRGSPPRSPGRRSGSGCTASAGRRRRAARRSSGSPSCRRSAARPR